MRYWSCWLLFGVASAHAADQAPLWEFGAGAAGLTLPAYRGSDATQHYVLPAPYFVYHGDFLKADRHGVRGELFEDDRFDLNISASASPPTTSDDIEARADMPDLKPTVEIGPELDIKLWNGNGKIEFLKLRLPLRQAFTVESSPRDIGLVFAPNLNADIRDVLGFPGWTLGIVAGPIFATERQHQYFYDVDPQYATASRPSYSAPGGYSGTQFLLSLSKRFADLWIGAYLRRDTLSGAVFADSPLVARDNYLSAGVAVSWVFARSSEMVDVNPEDVYRD